MKKAEKLALAYDKTAGFYLAFSGGKDSQCLYHVAKLAGVRFKSHMNLTSVDPPEVIKFVKHQYPDCELIKPKISIYNLAVKKSLLPYRYARWCCKEYKESAGSGKVVLIGIRHAESINRSKRNEVEISNRKFSGNLDELDNFRTEKNKHCDGNNNVTIVNADGERALGCIKGKESLLISPIIHWTDDDVWTFLNCLGISHCSLYDEGRKRIGCILCPMASEKQLKMDIKRWPHVRRNWISTIKRLQAKRKNWNIFSGSPIDEPSDEQLEETAKNEFEFYIQKKPYKQWYAEKFLQQSLNFDDE